MRAPAHLPEPRLEHGSDAPARVPARAHTRGGETGAVLAWVVIVVMVALFVLISVSVSSLGSLNSSKNTVSRTVGMAAADSGLQTLQAGLQNRVITEAEHFAPTQAQLQGLVGSSTVQAVPNSDSRIPTAATDVGNLKAVDAVYRYSPTAHTLVYAAALPPVTVIDRSDPANLRMWQVYRVELPNWYSTTSNNLVMFVRAWVSGADGKIVTKPRLIRAEFRPGYFADYQLVTDGAIHFEAGASLNGPVHTNGYDDDVTASRPSPSTVVWSEGSMSCSGASVIVTTAKGTIDSSIPPSCRPQAANNKFVDIGNVDESFAVLQEDYSAFGAGGPVVQLPPVSGAYDVRLSGNDVFITSSSVNRHLLISTTSAVLLDDDAYVHGNSTGRFTVAAHRPDDDDPFHNTPVAGAADITISDDVDMGSGAGDSLGLISQGNVVVATNGCKVHSVHAAMIAESGSITIPPSWTTDMYQDNPPHCGSIDIHGSIAGHRTPVMRNTWNNGDFAGYSARSYRYEPNLRTNTPPYFPVSDAWQVADWRDANLDCLSGTRKLDEDCL